MPKDHADRLAEKLAQFIDDHFGGSLMRCAAAAGVDRAGLHRWKQGTYAPSTAALARLARVGFDVNDALGFVPREKEED